MGIVPDRITHCMTGNDTPSSWTNTTPSTSGSEIWPGLMRSRLAAKDSSVPALRSHTSRVPNAAASQAAATAVQNESNAAPGTMVSAICMMIACPKSVPAATAIQPMLAATTTRTGRTIMPTSPVTAAAASNGHHEV